MRFDKLTTKFQQALADAQSLAVGQRQPVSSSRCTCCWRCSTQEDGGTASLLARAGVNVARAAGRRSTSAIERLPKVEGTAARCRSAAT